MTKPASKTEQFFKHLEEDALSKEQMLETLKQVVSHVTAIKKQTTDTIAKLEETYKNALASLNASREQDAQKLHAALATASDNVTQRHDASLQAISDRLATIKDGADGETPDIKAIAASVLALIKLPEERAVIMDGPEEIRNKLELLQDDERLDISAIKGVEGIHAGISAAHKVASQSGRGFQLLVGSTKKGLAQYLNFIAGTGMTVSHSTKQGRNDITFASGSTAPLTPTETPDGNLAIFTFAAALAQPSFIISDGVYMQATSKAGTTNWTWNAGAKQATLTIPPTDDILGII